jgi:hypothetical protein
MGWALVVAVAEARYMVSKECLAAMEQCTPAASVSVFA